MNTKVIANYGKITIWPIAGKTIYKYLCKWIKVGPHSRMAGKAIIVAPDMATAIEKASALRGHKPALVQKI